MLVTISCIKINVLFIQILELIRLTDLNRLFHIMPLLWGPCASTHLLLNWNLLGVHTVRGYTASSIEVHAVSILRRCVTAWPLREDSDRGSVLRSILRCSTSGASWMIGLAVVVRGGAHISICGNFLVLASRIVGGQRLIVVNCWFWLIWAWWGCEMRGGIRWGLVDTVILFWDTLSGVWRMFWLWNVNWAIQSSISTSECFLFLYNSLLNLIVEHREHILSILRC